MKKMLASANEEVKRICTVDRLDMMYGSRVKVLRGCAMLLRREEPDLSGLAER